MYSRKVLKAVGVESRILTGFSEAPENMVLIEVEKSDNLLIGNGLKLGNNIRCFRIFNNS